MSAHASVPHGRDASGSRRRLPGLSDLQLAVMWFSQVLSTQAAFYPLAVFSILKNSTRIAFSGGAIAGVFLILYVAVSVLVRNGSFDLMIKVVQFYCGILVILAAFRLDRKLSIGTGLIWGGALVVFYEIVSYVVFGQEPLTYAHPDLADGEAVGRANIGSGLVRAYGPAINASVSGSVLAITFFYLLASNSTRKGGLLLAVLAAFVLCGSLTSYAVFALLLIGHLRAGPRPRRERRAAGSGRRMGTAIAALLVLVAVWLLYYLFLSDFAAALAESKFNREYLDFVFDLKVEQIAAVIGGPGDLLLGADLSEATVGGIGGDFVMLDAIAKVGLLGLLGLFGILFHYCPRRNRVFLAAGLLSSLHYGTLFVLFGQVFFAALCADAVLRGRDGLRRGKPL